MEDIFYDMGFDTETTEEDTIVYILEDQASQSYFLATDDLGNTPSEDGEIIVACYSADDVYLWSSEFENITELFNLFKTSGSPEKFIENLKQLGNEE